MKKTIFFIILGVLTVGCIIFGSVYHVSGGFRNLKRMGFFVSDDWDDDGTYNWHFGISGDDEESNGSIDQKLESFKSISIDSSIMEIRIEEGDNFNIRGSWNKDWLRPEVEVKNGTLDIRQKLKRHYNNGSNKCRITISVPAGTVLKDINIQSNVGEIQFRKINAGDIDIDLNVGEIDLNDVSFDSVIINNNVGEVSVDSTVKLDDYDISLSTDVGVVEVNGRSYKRSYNQHGNGKKKVRINTNVGEVTLR